MHCGAVRELLGNMCLPEFEYNWRNIDHGIYEHTKRVADEQ